MPASKKTPVDDADPVAPLGGDQVQAQVDKETEQGFRGDKVDPRPDADYSLTTGPESPAHVPNATTRAEQPSAAAKES